MAEPDDDFEISKDARDILLQLHDDMAVVCASYCAELSDTELTDAQSIGVVAHMLITASAIMSVQNRIENLDGKPSVERWRSVTDEAFNRAVEAANSTPPDQS